MAQTHELLSSHGAQVSDSAAAVYTVPSSTVGYVKSILLHNTNTSAENVKLYFVENGGSVADSRLILNVSLEANETLEWMLEYPLPMETAGDTIQAVTDTASKVNIVISGMEETA